MKLSKKGLKKFERHEQIKKLGYVSLIDEIEFDPGDFKEMVCLTVKEAKILHELALSTIRFLRPESAKALLSLKKRIEQAEKKDEV